MPTYKIINHPIRSRMSQLSALTAACLREDLVWTEGGQGRTGSSSHRRLALKFGLYGSVTALDPTHETDQLRIARATLTVNVVYVGAKAGRSTWFTIRA